MMEIDRLINCLPRLQSRIEDPKKYLAIQGRLRLLRALQHGAFNLRAASSREILMMKMMFVTEYKDRKKRKKLTKKM